jgi:hypothetical protein
MNSDDFPAPSHPEPNESKRPWQQPIIEYLNLASSESDGGATFDGAAGSS